MIRLFKAIVAACALYAAFGIWNMARADQLRVHFRFDNSPSIGSGPLIDGVQGFTELVLYTDLDHADDPLFPIYGTLDHISGATRLPMPITGACRMGVPYPIHCALMYRNKEIRLIVYPTSKLSELAAPEWYTGFEIRYLRLVSSEIVEDSARVQ